MSPEKEQTLNPLASQLNDELQGSAKVVLEMFSRYGKRAYFPKGILSQSAEAKAKAHRFNATIGIATEGEGPMYLDSIHGQIAGVEPADCYTYAPPAGRPSLRQRWREKLLSENPTLASKTFGEPITTAAITHGLALVGDLFVDEGDVLLLPDKMWGNYRLAFEVHLGARIETYPFYEGEGFNVTGFAEGLARAAKGRDKLVVLLNFPNNPTGYMPTPAEGEGIVAALHQQAKRGTRIVVVIDDAYFGLFYHLGGDSMTESLFGPLSNLHENILAIKLDGATKELFVWGLRCGFVTYGPGCSGDAADAVIRVLDAKTRGVIRAGVSNVSQLSQTLVEHALDSPSIVKERDEKRELLAARAAKVHEVANDPRYRESFSVYPFNSGYFMLVKVEGVEAEKVRVHLLDEYGIGLIATAVHDLRIAFSCLEVSQVEPLFEDLHKAIQELV